MKKRLVCLLFGHQYESVPNGGNFLACHRCGKPGWLV